MGDHDFYSDCRREDDTVRCLEVLPTITRNWAQGKGPKRAHRERCRGACRQVSAAAPPPSGSRLRRESRCARNGSCRRALPEGGWDGHGAIESVVLDPGSKVAGSEARSDGAGATSGCAARNFASSSASSSRERNHTSSATPSCLSRSRQPRSTGISRRQGLHQVAHRLNHTHRPVDNVPTDLRAGVAGGSTRWAPVPVANSRSHHGSGGALAVGAALTAW